MLLVFYVALLDFNIYCNGGLRCYQNAQMMPRATDWYILNYGGSYSSLTPIARHRFNIEGGG